MFMEEKSFTMSGTGSSGLNPMQLQQQYDQNLSYIISLQNITEKLLFSMNIPKDIADKYNFLKQQTFDNLGLPYNPGVITYLPPPPSTAASMPDNSSTYSQQNYQSTGGVKKNSQTSPSPVSDSLQLFTQLEEVLKSMTEHSANMTKSIILDDAADNSFVQDSLSKKFLEPLSKKDYHFTQLPKDFMQRVDQIKSEFDQQIRKLIQHFNQQKEELGVQNDRKIELLKEENKRQRQELSQIRNQQERQCMCKYYEETLDKIKDENQRYVDKIKQKYESEIYDIRSKSHNFEAFRDKLFTDMNNRVVAFVQERNNAYLHTYCQEQGLQPSQIDPIELLFYIVIRLQGDNNWLVDKLAEVQNESKTAADELINSQLFSDLIDQTQISQDLLDAFTNQRQELMASLSSQGPNNKENIPTKRLNNNYGSVTNLRESLQSNKSNPNHNFTMTKSLSGQNLNLKYQQLMKNNRMSYGTNDGIGMDSSIGDEDYESIQQHQQNLMQRNMIESSDQYYNGDYKKQ